MIHAFAGAGKSIKNAVEFSRMTEKRSPSMINLMLKYPRCFWLQIVKKIKLPDTPFLSFPGGMDRILCVNCVTTNKKYISDRHWMDDNLNRDR